MIEMNKVRDRIYTLPHRFSLSPSLLDQCLDTLAPFRFGSITAPERGSDGEIYMTQQSGVEFTNDSDAVVFLMIISGGG